MSRTLVAYDTLEVPDVRDDHRSTKPAPDRPLRGRADVRRTGAAVRRGASPAPRRRDGPRGADPAGPHRRVLRARDHGDRDPREARRRRRHLLHVGARRRGARPRRRLGGRARRRPEHPGQQRDPALGDRGAAGPLLPEARVEVGRRLRPLRGGLGLRRLRPRLPRRGQGRPLRAHGTQALDHQRRRGRALHRPGQRGSGQGLQGHHRLPRGAVLPGLLGGQEGGQARDPGLVDVRADPRVVPGAEGTTSWARWARDTRSPSRP